MLREWNTIIQERHSHSEKSITVEASRRKQKMEKDFEKEDSGLTRFSTNLANSF